MSNMNYNIDDHSFYGSILSIGFLAMNQVLFLFDVEKGLHYIALLFSIIVSIDTLTGSKIKKLITSIFKKDDTHKKIK